MRIPMSVAVTLLPIDQLSSAVCGVMPSPYRSPMIRPLHVATKAAVISAAGSNAASTACFTFAASTSFGSGSFGSTSPIGHGSVEASGSLLFTSIGVKFTEFFPTGSVTHGQVPGQPRVCDVHGLGRAIDHEFPDLRALRIGA